MQTQKGFTHGIVVITIVILLIGGLSFVFWNSHIKNKSLKNAISDKSAQKIDTENINYKTFTSITGSGLSFTYPGTWSFNPPSKVTDFRAGSTTISYILFSQPMHIVNSRPEVANDSMCVIMSEFKGDLPFQSKLSGNYTSINEIMVGSSKVSIVELGGNVNSTHLKLVSSQPVSSHGAYYVALKNDYYLVANAQKNCYPSDKPIKRDISTDVEQAKLILQSVQLTE